MTNEELIEALLEIANELENRGANGTTASIDVPEANRKLQMRFNFEFVKKDLENE